MRPCTAILADPVFKEHRPPPMHPESPARYDAAVGGISAVVNPDRLLWIAPRSATEDEVALCHTREYIDIVKRDVLDSVPCLRTGDTDVSGRSFEVALRAVGALLDAVDSVASRTVANAFCPVRPPGHHASADRGMGFCIFNNVAIAARYAQIKHGLDRILIVDWDVHHGNGTQSIFYEDPSVFYFGTHQWPLYPGTGRAHERGSGDGAGFTLNRPVGAGSGGHEVIGSFRDLLVPAMREFKPMLVLLSAGFDGRVGDPIGNMSLTDDDFSELTGIVMEIAGEYADDRIVSAMEGGYQLTGLASAVGVHVRRLSEVY